MSYKAPVKDMLFNIEHLARIGQIAQMPGFEDAGLETAQAVLEECARFNEEVVAPLNFDADKAPSTHSGTSVTTSKGFKDAYKQYTEGGWQGLQHPSDFGGQGLPKTIGAACVEMLNSANLSFALCPLLTDGATEALLTAGSDELKSTYLEKLVSGDWTGTMNLTEPQDTSDRRRPDREAKGKAEKAGGTRLGSDFLKGISDDPKGKAKTPRAAVSGAAMQGLAGALARQFKPCYELGSLEGTSAMGIVTVLRLRYKPDGTVAVAPEVVEQTGITDGNRSYARQMSDVARRAVLRCTPVKLPAELYDGGWDDFQLRFIPSQMG